MVISMFSKFTLIKTVTNVCSTSCKRLRYTLKGDTYLSSEGPEFICDVIILLLGRAGSRDHDGRDIQHRVRGCDANVEDQK